MNEDQNKTQYDGTAEGIDVDTLEISDFIDESKLAGAEDISAVMAASCTTCECCCSCAV
ncbi:MAG: thiocillin/thiostrepton family thiazolyl peptide [Myxococcales bacterium]|nr:thiocillin/thiostrepton family thiazolyl peptide [Myxococcales bacterium]